MPKRPKHSLPLKDRVAAVAGAVTVLQEALGVLAVDVQSLQVDPSAAAELEADWSNVRRTASTANTRLRELAVEIEDALDRADSDAALREAGSSIPWETVKAEFRLP